MKSMSPFYLAAILSLALFGTACSKKDPQRTTDFGHRGGGAGAAQTAGAEQSTLTLPNGLEILLVSSPKLQKASAAMAVPSGSWADPEEHLGLAHYLEHMLFLGSRDFPDAAEYNRYINENGGNSNAYTARDLTNYFFEVNPEAFAGAVHRFSQFFVAPSFEAQFAEREKNAVHSEFDKNIRDDGWRFWQLLGNAAPEGHPARKFNIGSLETLKNVTPEVLQDFYNKHYSADTMKLVLMSPLPLPELEALAKTYFQEVPNRNLKQAAKPATPPRITGGQWLEMKTLTDENSLTLVFPVENFAGQWKSKPGYFLESLIGGQGEGSLASKLRRSQLATELSVNTFDSVRFGDPYSGQVMIAVNLTAQGAQQTDKVLAEIYGYIGFLAQTGVKEYSFKEAQALHKISFANRGLVEGGSEASRYAAQMLIRPPLEINSRDFLLHEYDSALVQRYLRALTPANTIVVRTRPDAVTESRERFYGTEYTLKNLPADWLAKMNQAWSAGTSALYPAPNPYIPTDLALFRDEPSTSPKLLSEDASGRLWFQQETFEETKPKGFTLFKIFSPLSSRSARDQLLSQLFVKAYRLAYVEKLYPSVQAGYEVKLESQGSGIQVEILGHSHGLPRLVRDTLANPKAKLNQILISESEFELLKVEMGRELANLHLDGAIQRAIAYHRRLTQQPSFALEDLEAALTGVTLADLKTFATEFSQELYVEGLIYGNLKSADFSGLAADIVRAQGAKPLSEARVNALRTKESVPDPASKLAAVTTDKNNNNAFFTRIDAGPRTPRNAALVLLAGTLLQGPFYTEMRSVQQLGYIVQGSGSQTPERATMILLIQSANHSANELARRSQAFVQDWLPATLASLDQRLDAVRSGLVTELSQEAADMDSRYKELRHIFLERKAEWNLNRNVVAALKELTADEVKTFMQNTLSPEKQSRLTVYYHKDGSPPPELLEGETLIDSRQGFARPIP